ncbi:MAG: GNAT family N-acetyltransferase [Alloprevotella sp.]
MTPSLSLPPVGLRALEPTDLDLLYEIENDPSVWDVTSSPSPWSRWALRQYLESQPADITQTGQLRLVVEADGQKAGMGFVDLFAYDATQRRAEVGIAIRRSARRTHIGLAALQALQRYAKAHLHLRLLYAKIRTSDEACHGLFAAAGYRRVATLPQWHLTADGAVDVDVLSLVLE